MRHALSAATALAASALLLTPAMASAVPAGDSTDGHRAKPNVTAEVEHAMDTEAFAYAQYNAYADNAADNPTAANAWRTIADVEYWDHFVLEGGLVGLVGDNKDNLKKAIASEAGAVDSYAQWAKIAESEGCTQIARVFTSIRADEVDHHTWFTQALAALDGTGTIPAPPPVTPRPVPAGKPACDKPGTMKALDEAMHSESLAWGQYSQWAQKAANTGNAQLAALFTGIGNVELKEHWNGEADLSGFVADTKTNLAASAQSEVDAVAMYTGYIADAKKAGQHKVATTLTEVRSDEKGHLAVFTSLGG